jgi:hypothetical protein
MQVTHPRAGDAPLPSVATVAGTDYRIEDGVVDAPETAARTLADAWAERFDADPEALIVAETCDTVKADGEICGRELPCPYHSED